jgi:hypothetical protein
MMAYILLVLMMAGLALVAIITHIAPARMKLSLLIGLIAVMICGCNSCPDLSALKVDSHGNISWADAEKIILGCEVDTVMQSHALAVSITLKDGRQFRAIEPKIDEVWILIKKHGLEKKIRFATE